MLQANRLTIKEIVVDQSHQPIDLNHRLEGWGARLPMVEELRQGILWY